MKNIIGISTGSIYKLIESNNIDAYITYIREDISHMINAIEILIPENKLKTFKLSEGNKEWLKKLDWISFHLPKNNININNQEDIIRIINSLPKLDAIIIHCDISISGYINLQNKKYKNIILYENTEHNNSIDFAEKICFDTSHALSFNYFYTLEFIKKYQNRIKQIHLSNYDSEDNFIHYRFHLPFYKDSRKFFKLKNMIDFKAYPIIIESTFEDLEDAKREINFIKENV